jgi:hypothetical protein
MYKKLGIILVLLISVTLIQFPDSSAQIKVQQKKSGDPVFKYDKRKDQTTIIYKDGRKIIADGEWDKDDLERFERKMEKLEDRLSDLEIELDNIVLPDLSELDILQDLDIRLENLDRHIDIDFEDIMDQTSRALKNADIQLRHLDELEDLHIDLRMHDFEHSLEDMEIHLRELEDIEIDIPEIHFDIPDLNIELPDINEILRDIRIHELDIKELNELKSLKRYNWDRGSVKNMKKRPGIIQ